MCRAAKDPVPKLRAVSGTACDGAGMFDDLDEAAVAVPAIVHGIAAGRPLRPVWVNELGGVTFVIGAGSDRQFVKWSPFVRGVDLRGEADRLTWARSFVAAPEVIALGAGSDAEWMVTAGLPGDNAVAARWKADPATAVRALGTGLRLLHDALPVATCPFDWGTDARLGYVEAEYAAGRLDPKRWGDEFAGVTPEAAMARLRDVPPVDRLVVAHGDACAPNTLIGDGGVVTGHVDFGSLGRADRWADLAVATWSTVWNYGPGWERPLLDAYGVDPDPIRTEYYRMLWAAGP